MQKKIKLLCTLGPSSLNERTIMRLDAIGVDIFRINISHTEIGNLEKIIKQVKQYTDKPLCIDTEGAQVRTGYVENDRIYLEEDSTIEITSEKIIGKAHRISLNPTFAMDQIKLTDLISIDFESVLLQVVERTQNSIIAKVICGGFIGSNKAVTIDRQIDLPVISAKDKEAIVISRSHGIHYFALSFANSRDNVEKFRSYVGEDAYLISKIESKLGVENIDEICDVTDAILIDRGDLSRDEPIDKIPFIQKLIIQKASSRKIPVYVATNLLESMVKSKKPTRAETNDVINTLLDGADGLVLAAETAIGTYPVNCALMISRIVKHFQDFSDGVSLEELQKKNSFLLVEPHGGILVNRVNNDFDMKEIRKYKVLEVDKTVLLDAEQIAIGAFSPLEGFMTEQEVESVLSNYKLPNGAIWPLPIVLQINQDKARSLNTGETVALLLKNTDEIYALLHIEDIYSYDLDKMAKEIFRTNDSEHPGVQLLKRGGNYFLGGRIELIKRLPSEYKRYEITPQQTRTIFENKGWSRVVGFHTRNVIHRAHEYIQMFAFEKFHCDGLFVHPVVGPKRKGDYKANVILKCYELMLERYYPKGKVILGAFQNYSRYCGPREAVFTALCRKNFGCSHFIVGRDHTGVGNYYKPDEVHRLFEYLGDIGIEPIFFNEIHFCKKCNRYVDQCAHSNENFLYISGTEGRRMLQAAKYPPDWFMREDISSLMINEIKKRKDIFIS